MNLPRGHGLSLSKQPLTCRKLVCIVQLVIIRLTETQLPGLGERTWIARLRRGWIAFPLVVPHIDVGGHGFMV
jgi:hypothetical protein